MASENHLSWRQNRELAFNCSLEVSLVLSSCMVSRNRLFHEPTIHGMWKGCCWHYVFWKHMSIWLQSDINSFRFVGIVLLTILSDSVGQAFPEGSNQGLILPVDFLRKGAKLECIVPQCQRSISHPNKFDYSALRI